MKVFSWLEIHEATAHAEAGHRALHLHDIIPYPERAPRCFVQAVKRGEPIAHLYDMDKPRLIEAAKQFGINIVVVEYEGTKYQHVDFCGGPLRKLLVEHYKRLLRLGKQQSIARLHFILRPYKGTATWL